jgi:hypothetical protein
LFGRGQFNFDRVQDVAGWIVVVPGKRGLHAPGIVRLAVAIDVSCWY